jgi:hypothetical protein
MATINVQEYLTRIIEEHRSNMCHANISKLSRPFSDMFVYIYGIMGMKIMCE